MFNYQGRFVSKIRIVSVLNQVANKMIGSKDMNKNISIEINKLKCEESHMKIAASAYVIKVFRQLEDCEACAISMTKWTMTGKCVLHLVTFQENVCVLICLIKGKSLKKPSSGHSLWITTQITVKVTL